MGSSDPQGRGGIVIDTLKPGGNVGGDPTAQNAGPAISRLATIAMPLYGLLSGVLGGATGAAAGGAAGGAAGAAGEAAGGAAATGSLADAFLPTGTPPAGVSDAFLPNAAGAGLGRTAGPMGAGMTPAPLATSPSSLIGNTAAKTGFNMLNARTEGLLGTGQALLGGSSVGKALQNFNPLAQGRLAANTFMTMFEQSVARARKRRRGAL